MQSPLCCIMLMLNHFKTIFLNGRQYNATWKQKTTSFTICSTSHMNIEQISGGNAYFRKVTAHNCSSILLAVQIQLFTVDENRLLIKSAANQLQTGCWLKVLLESHLCSLQRAVCDQTQERNNSDECFNFDNHVTSHVRSWTGVELLII